MIANLYPTLPAWTPLASAPSTLRVLCLGDSTTDDNNPGHFDGLAVSAGITCHYKSTTEYSTTGTATWASPNSGLYSNICERALLRTGVSAVQMVTEAVSGSVELTHRRDQLTDGKIKWDAEGWDPPHLVVVAGYVNDLTFNGSGSDGAYDNGLVDITEASTERRMHYLVRRVRAQSGWRDAQVVFLVPMMETATYPQTDDLATWMAAAAAKMGGVSTVDVRATRVLLNDKHIDADDLGGGNTMVADAILDEVSVL